MNRPGDDPIEHVVVLMLENRSFDQMLGAFQRVYPKLDGVDVDDRRPNIDSLGNLYYQQAGAAKIVELDPHHDLASVLRQIGADPAIPGPTPDTPSLRRLLKAICNADWCGWPMKIWEVHRKKKPTRMAMAKPYEGYFIAEYERSYPRSSPEQRQQVMSYFDIQALPALHALAEHFTICDQWFSSVPGLTWANRFFFHSGTARGTTWLPEKASDFASGSLFDQETLYDRLTAAGRSWRIYFHDFPQSLALTRLWTRESRLRFSVIDDFERDAQGPSVDFPDFVFIEPQYMGSDANDDHPPHDTMLAQELIARVYNAIRANGDLWSTTLLVIVYDEHGGFYDHVESPAAVCPDDYQAEYSFDQLGVRVPAILVSPWVKAGVWSERLDHTCGGKYLCDKWGMTPLGKRMAQANSLKGAIAPASNSPRNNTPKKISRTPSNFPFTAMKITSTETPNGNQRALMALADYLEPAQPLSNAYSESIRGAAIKASDSQAIRSKALRFIEKP